MNLILCEQHEVGADGIVRLTGVRATHVRAVLRASVGDTVQIGIIDGPKGRGEILAIDDDDDNGGGESDGRNGGGGGARGHGRGGVSVALRCDFATAASIATATAATGTATPAMPPRPAVDLLLALPRPKVLQRLWAQLAALGVGRIILTNAERVERHYFDTHILDEATYRPLLIEGLQQACDTRLPRVTIHRQFRILIEDELDALSNDGMRLVAHPHADRPLSSIGRATPSETSSETPAETRSETTSEASSYPSTPPPSSPRALLAIGPEGGWNAFELTLLKRHRFEPISMGPRVLRTDTACIALLALLHESLRGRDAISLAEKSRVV